jgi:glycosyltransferase involved in cell wall biosynthesis
MTQYKPYNVCLIHMADPRGMRVGGTETYVRDYIYYHPADMNLLYIGPDEIGDLELGKIVEIEFRGRKLKYLPIYRVHNSLNIWVDSVMKTDTFTLAKALLKNWSLVRKVLRDGKYSVELRRVEIAPIVRSFGVPYVQMEHIMQEKGHAKSGVLGKYPFIGTVAEFISAGLCYRFYLVNSNMTEVFRKRFWPFARKFDTLTTWANTQIYRPTPFQGGPLKMLFAGRADDFKRLDIMLEVVKRVADKMDGAVEFHYVGDGDLNKYAEYEAVKAYTVLHGRKSATELAAIQSQIHIGLLTSAFEGMPRFVMETLTAGRAVVALHLPQLEAVMHDGRNGYLVPRQDDQVEVLADRIVETYAMIGRGEIDPNLVAESVKMFSPERLLSKIFNDHRALHALPPVYQAA